MAQYLTKFEAWRTATFAQDDNAAQPAGWTGRFGESALNASRIATPYEGSTGAKLYSASNRAVIFKDVAFRAGFAWDLIDPDANRGNVEILAGAQNCYSTSFFALTTSTTNQLISVFLRGSNAATTYYAAEVVANNLRVWKVVAGAATSLASVTVSTSSTAPNLLRFRANGTTLQARAWPIDSIEPTTWPISITDTSIAAAGYVGVRCGLTDLFSVGTNGDAAPTPKMLAAANAELVSAINGGKPVLLTCDIEVPGFTGSTTVAGRVFRRYSNMAFDSGSVAPVAGEVYSARLDAIPAVSRDMNELGGVVKVGGADLRLANGDGALDDLFRMRLFRMAAVCRIGLPGWPWYDLLPYHQGVIQDVSDDGGQTVTIAIDGTAREFDGDVSLTYSTSGVNDKKPLPQQNGGTRNVSPTLVDATTLTYQYHTGADRTIADVRDRGVSLNAVVSRSIVALDAAADTLQTSAAHPWIVGDWVKLSGPGALPAPLAVGTVYEIKSVPASDKFTLTATRGGALIDLTGVSGALSCGASQRLYVDYLGGGGIFAPTGCVILCRQPAGQITMDVNNSSISYTDLLKIIGLAASKSTLSASYPSGSPFNLFLRDRATRMTVVEEMSARGVPVTFSRSGALSWRKINFANIEGTFTEADCFGVPKLTKTLQPTAGRVGEPNWTVQSPTDLAGSVTPANVALYGLPQYYLITALGIDYQQGLWWGGLVDDPALYRDTLPDKSVGGIAATNVLTGTGYTTLNSNEGRQRAAGVYEITVAFKSVLLDCGDVVKLTHRRHFFKDVVNEIDVSPERPATDIGAQRQPSLAVVTKIVDDPANSRQVLTLYRPMPTLFPVS